MKNAQHLPTLVSKHEHRSIHWLPLQHEPGDRYRPVNSVAKTDRLVHDQDRSRRSNRDHRPPPAIANSEVTSPIVSAVAPKSRTFTPAGVSTSAKARSATAVGGASSMREYDGTIVPLRLRVREGVRRPCSAFSRLGSSFVARATTPSP